jgi:hypothetical protein
MQDIMKLCDIIRETGFAIHNYLYENALAHRLRKKGQQVSQQHPLNVFDKDGTLLGNFFADLFVENRLIVDLKAVRYALGEHVAQLPGYLRASRIEHGLLINFGAPKFQIKKYIINDVIEQTGGVVFPD